MFYATYTEGNKSGGFNEAETFANPENFEFDSEHSRSFEIGSKNSFLNDKAHFNLNLFYTQYKDLQVSALTGTDLIVGNAAKSTSKGIELELDWQMLEGLTLAGTFNWLHSKYDSFPNANCTAHQELANGRGSICTQDLSGKTTQFAPDFSGTVSLDYWRPIPSNMVLSTQVDVPFSNGYYFSQDLDPETYQNSFFKLNARVALSSSDGQWEVAIIGRNLTDKRTLSYADDVPILNGSHFGVTERPRTIAFHVKVQF